MLAAIAVTCVSGRRDLRELASTETENWVPQVPDAIKVPAGYKLHLNLFGEGHQYYRYNGSSWVQFSAKASLYDAEGKEIGQHFYLPHLDALGGQPSWKTQPSKAVPYSRVTAKAVVKISTDPQSIPWILLNATEVTATSSHIPASQNDYRTLLLPYVIQRLKYAFFLFFYELIIRSKSGWDFSCMWHHWNDFTPSINFLNVELTEVERFNWY